MLIFPPVRDTDSEPALPPEKVKDERQRFRTDIFGIETGGLVTLPVQAVRHTAKSIVWKIRDYRRGERLKEILNAGTPVLSLKDIRILILVWRDGLLDPRLLTKADRAFVIRDLSGSSKSHKAYLSDMEYRGIVTSLVVSGHLVFRANIIHEEVMELLVEMAKTTDNCEDRDTLVAAIKLLADCFDPASGSITIPPPG